ncbi:glycerol-3-phosphate dehydrogenase [NAD(+)], cytoplasmic-like [Tachypleus tridentatus]|uniref:glycerol-3-phosphate dehydrogenase [NAD(+)], cytoplasmic-like n=1 Tax=Tachypleus tridentatus TaxID=6853 RepID=UPI003FCF2354
MENQTLREVAVIGSGSWATTIARLVAKNIIHIPYYNSTVKIYVREEEVGNKSLVEILRTQHENVKYLPGFTIPSNVLVETDIIQATENADIIIFAVPHSFLEDACKCIAGRIKPSVMGLSLIKGLIEKDGKLELGSDVIRRILGIEVSVLMGATFAFEVAAEELAETTLGCSSPEAAYLFSSLLKNNYLCLTCINDVTTVELCGALKSIVACAAGFIDGLGYGENVKAAVVRLGLVEMIWFTRMCYPGAKLRTFLENCGVGDLIASCYGHRDWLAAKYFITGKVFNKLEENVLKGQVIHGPETAALVGGFLQGKELEYKFPLFVAVHKIWTNEVNPTDLIDLVRNHPAYENAELQ